ncbi:hypothetical protein DXG01_002348 [Tephrocybe rancida]|nr:hypothetical protein DXG01_002348 [Tephrocybe rancida]
MPKFGHALPPELVDIAIDNLGDDVQALKACNLVCKAWQPRTRFHLFKTVYLDLSLPPKSLDGFLTHIAKPTSYFHTTLRTLSLRSEFDPQRQHDLTALMSLRGLTSIALMNWSSTIPDPHWFRGASLVKHLDLLACRIDCLGFAALLQRLPLLESLKLTNVSWRDSFDIDQAAQRHGGGVLKHLRKLHLGPHSTPVIPALAEMISRGILEGQIQEVELEDVELRSETLIGDLLVVVGASLRSLTISAKSRLNHVDRAFALERNINLNSVHFVDLIDPSHGTRYMNHFSFDWVMALLLQLPDSTEMLTFSFWLIPGDTLGLDKEKGGEGIDWPTFVWRLMRLKRLRHVELRLGAQKLHRCWIRKICEQRFPELKEVLRVTCNAGI